MHPSTSNAAGTTSMWHAADFTEGDIWFFDSNEPHVVLGVEDGCTFVSVYDQGDFDERQDARGLSGFFTSAPAGIAAQVMRAPHHACQHGCSGD